MSVRRVMGTEVEYGISVPGQPTANPTTLSSQVVNAWAVLPCTSTTTRPMSNRVPGFALAKTTSSASVTAIDCVDRAG